MATDNPARLLHDILDAARQTSEARADNAIDAVWGAVFTPDTAERGRRLAQVYQLPDQVRRTVVEFGMESAIDEPMNLIERASLLPATAAWSNFWDGLGGDGTLRILKLAEEVINLRRGDDRFAIHDVDGLRNHLTSLLDEVREGDLPPDVKQTALQHLH